MEMHNIQDCVQVNLPAQEVQVNHFICLQKVVDQRQFTFHVTDRKKRVRGRCCAINGPLIYFWGNTFEKERSYLKKLVREDVTVFVPRNQTVKLLYKGKKSTSSNEFVFEPIDRCLSEKEVTLKLSETSVELIQCWEREQIRRVWVSAVMLPDDQFRPYLVETDEKLITGFRKNLLVILERVKLSDVTIYFL